MGNQGDLRQGGRDDEMTRTTSSTTSSSTCWTRPSGGTQLDLTASSSPSSACSTRPTGTSLTRLTRWTMRDRDGWEKHLQG